VGCGRNCWPSATRRWESTVPEAIHLDDYRRVVPPQTIDLLRRLAGRVRGRSLLHVNSTRVGGGVAEMLSRYVPLFEELGVPVRWDVISGAEEFFRVTKSLHNALQGQEQAFTAEMLAAYLETNRENAARLHLDSDVVIIHDPQPAALIVFTRRPASAGTGREGGRWVWRWPIDGSRPPPRGRGVLPAVVPPGQRGGLFPPQVAPPPPPPPLPHSSPHQSPPLEKPDLTP